MRRRLIELKSQRTTLLENAEALLKEGKQAEYRAEMEKVSNMNGEISDVEKLLEEQDRKFMEQGKTRPRRGTRPWSAPTSCARAAR